jgi:DNA polymerase-3 subunit gamma/tau
MEAEAIQVEEKALRYVAKTADGSMRDALSLLDQCIAFHFGETLTYDMVLNVLGAVDTEVFSRLLRHVVEQDVTGCITLLEEIVMQGRELTQFVTDFTWYLRNLLLIQSSDDIEDVIDVSSDNLARLKEESQMLEASSIIRYIRIFSELSGQMKYASQKRILIEIALIKLCRPGMEQDYDSLLERVRTIEKQLENGIALSPIGEQGHVDETAGGAVSGQLTRQNRPPLPKAIPEDVQMAVGAWQNIVAQTSMPMKQYLKDARLSLGGDNRLVVVVEDGLASDYFLKQEGHKEILEQLLSEAVGKEIDVAIQSVQGQDAFVQNYVDLSQLVHMDIDIEDEESE